MMIDGYADSIVNTLREPLLVLDAALRVRTASPAFYRVFNATPESTIDQRIYDLGERQWDIPALRNLLERILPGSSEFHDFPVEHNFPHIGRRFMLLDGRRMHDDGQTNLILLAIEDVTERRQAEQKLAMLEARYRRLFEAAHDGILILDAESGRILDVNKFLLDLLRYPREHFLGKQLWEIGMFQDIQSNKVMMQQLQERGEIRFEDLPLQDRDGQQIPVEFVSNRYAEDSHIVFQCNIRDIRQRKLVEREREALLAQEHAARVEAQASERANHAKDIFLATLSHEMRTPLNAILGWANILRKEGCSPEDLREGVEVIERNARAQSKLIEDVLDISRIVAGKLRLELVPCDLRSVITAAVETVRPAADAKGIPIEVEMQATSEGFDCDTHRIQQVVWNLLSNAIKFSPQGRKVKVSLRRERTLMRIAVSDNGQGISPEFLPYVFDRFRQADSSTKRKFGGLGLGLSIAKNLVELHGGTMEVESGGAGKGSTFSVLLPIHAVKVKNTEIDPDPAGESVSAAKDAHDAVRLDGLRILVVDDEADARRLVSKVLEDAGAQVTSAASVRAALQALHEQRRREELPHVLISDLSMPEDDGFDLIRQVRGLGYTVPQLPAVALTAFADKGYARSALLAGFQIHVAKPVDAEDLIAVVASLTGRTGE